MFYKAKVVIISEEIHKNTLPIMRIVGIFGLFPFVLRRRSSGLFLKWSPWFALYSFAIGGLIIFSACYIHIHDIFLTNADSLDFVTSTDKIVGLTVLSGYAMIAICGVFIVPNKFLQFFEYLKCISEVDSIINTTSTKLEKYRSIALLFVLFAYNLVLQAIGNYLDYMFSGAELGFLKIFRRNYSISALCHMTLCAEYVSRHIALTLDKRLIQLNKSLSEYYLKVIEPNQGPSTSAFDESLRVADIEAIVNLNKVYLSLVNAGEILNKLFALNNLIAVTSILFQLVVAPYFIILLLQGQRKGGIELTLRCLIFFLQIIRITLIIEPWYACMNRVETTSHYICKLLSLNIIERHYRKTVNAFAISLCLRRSKFTAWGLFNMNRLLFTSLIGTVTTYVAILLQAQQNDIQ